jgi:hypothetical protein
MSERLPKMFVDLDRPGIIRHEDDPTAGILAGMRAKDICAACNYYNDLLDLIQTAKDGRYSSEAIGIAFRATFTP